MTTHEKGDCSACDGSGIRTYTLKRRYRNRPVIVNEGMCLTCLGTGKEI